MQQIQNMNSRKHKTLEEEGVILTPNSSVKSSVTVDWSPSSTRDSSYFPGCKKDANCNCEICIASINATRDLVARRRSLRRFPASISRSPVSFNPDLPTPKSTTPPSRIDFPEKVKRRKIGLVMRIFWGLILVFGVDYGISWMVSGLFKARLSTDIVKNLGSKSRDFESLGARLLFLKVELEELVGKEVSSCNSNDDSLWKIEQVVCV